MNSPLGLSLPDRYDMLKRVASGHMSEIISAVDDSLERIDELYEEMLTSSRGAFLILRGDSGTGKSTFIHTVGLFRDGVDTKTVTKDEDVGSVLGSLNATDAGLRIIVLEGREALTDISNELLEKDIHAINSFIRTTNGEKTLIAWPVNRDDLAERLSGLAAELGGESLVGLGDPIYRFSGPLKEKYIEIANNTISLLNQGENIHDLGISSIRAEQLLDESKTIGFFLAKIRKDLLANQREIGKLAKKKNAVFG